MMAVEKYYVGQANYAKGKGDIFQDYMWRYHHDAYLFPVSRACGGTFQDKELREKLQS